MLDNSNCNDFGLYNYDYFNVFNDSMYSYENIDGIALNISSNDGWTFDAIGIRGLNDTYWIITSFCPEIYYGGGS